MTPETFFFELPLYSRVELPEDVSIQAALYQKSHPVLRGEAAFKPTAQLRVDGHCPECAQRATFAINAESAVPNGDPWWKILERRSFDEVHLVCTRNGHVLRYFFFIDRNHITKIGQFPSLADIANDEASLYRGVLNREDATEFHKAIGLAAHGVGIGSFVYLRRIFERLVNKRFSEFKDAEGWRDEEFFKLRMDEKIGFLSDHLPAFLVENKKLYSVLSRGIHELSDEVCLRAFEFIKLSMKIIMDEDKKKQEELKLRQLASAAITDFQSEI